MLFNDARYSLSFRVPYYSNLIGQHSLHNTDSINTRREQDWVLCGCHHDRSNWRYTSQITVLRRHDCASNWRHHVVMAPNLRNYYVIIWFNMVTGEDGPLSFACVVLTVSSAEIWRHQIESKDKHALLPFTEWLALSNALSPSRHYFWRIFWNEFRLVSQPCVQI